MNLHIKKRIQLKHDSLNHNIVFTECQAYAALLRKSGVEDSTS